MYLIYYHCSNNTLSFLLNIIKCIKNIVFSGVYLVNRLNTNSSRELVSAYWL